jgi:hypothetical protein
MSVKDITAIANEELMQYYENWLKVYELNLCDEECTALRLKVAMYDAKNENKIKEYEEKMLEWVKQLHVVDQAHAKCIAQKKLIQTHEKNMNRQ